MLTQKLQDNGDSFEVSVRKAAAGAPVVLFSVGSGGQPQRLSTLLGALIECGCTVVAPISSGLLRPPQRKRNWSSGQDASPLHSTHSSSPPQGSQAWGIQSVLPSSSQWPALNCGWGHVGASASHRTVACLAWPFWRRQPASFKRQLHLMPCEFQFWRGWARPTASPRQPKQNGLQVPCVIGTLWMCASPKELAISRSWTFRRHTPRSRCRTSKRFCKSIRARSASLWGRARERTRSSGVRLSLTRTRAAPHARTPADR